MGLLIRIAEMVATPRRVSMSLGLAADRRMTLSEVDQSVIVRVKKIEQRHPPDRERCRDLSHKNSLSNCCEFECLLRLVFYK
jgi:hypothetical protein